MSAETERQGYLGDLTQKSMEELKDLLRRQEHLAANSKFMNRLPDKGAKVHQKIATIEEAIAQKADLDRTADLFHNMVIQSERNQRREELNEEEQMLHRLANRNEESKVVTQEEPENAAEPVYVNTYQKVIKQAEKRKSPKQKFLPNRSLHTKHMHEMSGNLKNLSVTRDVVTLEKPGDDSAHTDTSDRVPPISSNVLPPTSQPSGSNDPSALSDTAHTSHSPVLLKHRYDEALEETCRVNTGQSHCVQAQMITIEESFALQDTQKRQAEMLLTQQAAEKLSRRLNFKMSDLNPEGSTFERYRDAEGSDEDQDSDDDDVVEEYPD